MLGSGHRRSVIWLTGLPGSGKSVLADRLFDDLHARRIKAERLDGDALRAVFPSTGFDREERTRHIRRAGEMAAQFEREGAVVVASFISPYCESRGYVRSICSHFVEIFVKASLEVCEKRDPKGLYGKARSGEIRNFTGLDDPYEEPEHPELVIDTEHQTVEQSFVELKRFVDGLLGS
jgi:adenylylsulfate kinase